MTVSYEQFLESKLITNVVAGFDIDHSLVPSQAFQFQKDMLRWSVNKGRAGLYIGTGSGKTLLELSWGKQLKYKEPKEAILLLAPLGVTPQTVREGKKFDIEINLCESQQDIKPGLNITNYEKLHKFNTDNFIGVIADESSILKDYTGKTTNELIERFKKTPYRLAASATPSPNDYMEIGTQAEFLGVMSRVEMLSMFFVHDGGETSKWRLKGHAEQEFWKWVSTWACFMTHPSDLGYYEPGFDLPPLNINEIVLEVECKDTLFPVGKLSLEQRRQAKRDSIEDRIKACADMINTSNETWLVWCNLNEEGDKLEKLINNSVQIAGKDTNENKEQRMIDFADNKIKCLITKLQIAGRGLNWQNCHNMAFVGLGDSFEYYYQGIRRCWRFGQKEEVNVYVITSSAEGAIVDNIKRKEKDYEKMTKEITKYTKEYVRDELSQTTHQKNEYKTNTVETPNYKLMLGDCVERIKEIKDQSIDYSIYSPPFSSLYTYSNSERDMGNCRNYEEFSQHFDFLAKELFRVIKDGRLMSVHCMNLPTTKQHTGYIGIQDFRGDLIRLFQSVGFIYHSEVVIWKDPVTAMQRTKALGLLYKQLRKDSVMSRQGIPDYLVTFRKPGENKEPVTKTHEGFPVDLWQRYASPVWFDINPSETLQKESAREEKDEKHIAPLQLEVIRRALELWTNPNDLVLTPFLGIGSELYESLKLKRRGIGIELKESYFKQAVLNCQNAVIKANTGTLFDLLSDSDSETFGSNEIEEIETESPVENKDYQNYLKERDIKDKEEAQQKRDIFDYMTLSDTDYNICCGSPTCGTLADMYYEFLQSLQGNNTNTFSRNKNRIKRDLLPHEIEWIEKFGQEAKQSYEKAQKEKQEKEQAKQVENLFDVADVLAEKEQSTEIEVIEENRPIEKLLEANQMTPRKETRVGHQRKSKADKEPKATERVAQSLFDLDSTTDELPY